MVMLLQRLYYCFIIGRDEKITKTGLQVMLGTKRQTGRKAGTQSHRPKAAVNRYGGWVAEIYDRQPSTIGSPDLAGCFFIAIKACFGFSQGLLCSPPVPAMRFEDIYTPLSLEKGKQIMHEKR
jgi:hypothetical protein